ncbi:hypothetical protein [Polyangium aurulentum]|uniref:hypothetical protein n=1 Tax=Polyangium aurulentum TaxID=2567896 RepID=UPI0010AE0659|nr:hypothetical protein [Polyangium aurulentum]UQA59115.1 hypothetical protein E8A73_000940 [Polyangium aurulentum]
MRVGVTLGYAWTDLVFNGETDAAFERRSVLATFETRLSPKWTLQAGAGGFLWGSLRVGGERHLFGPGWAVSASGTYRLRDGADGYPFVILSGSLSVAGARTRLEAPGAPEVPYYAGDIRIGAVAGKTFYDVLSPYALARVFGGPIFWRLGGESLAGTDRYHFQIGAGIVVALPMGLDAFAEIVPLGERAVSCGAGFTF